MNELTILPWNNGGKKSIWKFALKFDFNSFKYRVWQKQNVLLITQCTQWIVHTFLYLQCVPAFFTVFVMSYVFYYREPQTKITNVYIWTKKLVQA